MTYDPSSSGLEICLVQLTQLSELSLCGQDMAINNDVMRTILHNCKKLKILNIQHCYGVGNEGLKHLSRLTDIESLHIGHLKEHEDEAIRAIRRLPLRILDMRGSIWLTDKGASTILQSHKRLEELNFRSCRAVTNLFLQDFCGQKPLTILNKGSGMDPTRWILPPLVTIDTSHWSYYLCWEWLVSL